MKKLRIRIFALCMALTLIAPLLARPAKAYELESYEGTPLFVVGIKDPDGKYAWVFNAFLVGDPETGGVFLLGSSMIFDLTQQGYTAELFGDDGFHETIFPFAKQSGISYLYALGLDDAPYLVLSESSTQKAAAIYREVEEDGLSDPIQKNYNLGSGWKKDSSGAQVYSGHKLETFYLVGAPMVSTEDSTVLGCVSMNSDGETLMYPISQGWLSTDYSIETLTAKIMEGRSEGSDSGTEGAPDSDSGSSGGSEPAPDSENGEDVPDSDGKSSFPWVAVLAVAAVLGYLIYRSNTKKKNAGPKEGTVPLEPVFHPSYGDSGPMVPMDPIYDGRPITPSMDHIGSTTPVQDTPKPDYGPTTPVSQWQLRCLGGGMDGRVFPVSGTVHIGRNPQCEIAFPDNTPGVSGNHCEVSLEGYRVVLRDLNATYGTYLGANNRLEAHRSYELHMGDTFTLAQNGPAFRLEKIGASMEEYGPAVRDLAGRTYRADAGGRLTFGRGSGNGVSVSEQSISGSHCVLYREAGKLYLMDLGSTNGTFFSDTERLKPNTPYRIRKGMAFFLCSAKNTFVVTEE